MVARSTDWGFFMKGRQKGVWSISDEQLKNSLLETATVLGRSPTTKEIRQRCKQGNGYSATVYKKRFGSIRNAKELVGLKVYRDFIPYNEFRPKRFAPLAQRFQIFQRDGFRCVYCGQDPHDGIKLVIDHVLPAIKGGKTIEANLVTACSMCNSGKRDHLLEVNMGKHKQSSKHKPKSSHKPKK